MKKLSSIIVFLVLISGCEKNDNTCNCKDPIKDLAFLTELKASFTNCTCEMSIIQATYGNQTVFYSAMTDPLCDGIYPVVLLDCKGNTVKAYAGGDPAAYTEVTGRRAIYRCKNK